MYRTYHNFYVTVGFKEKCKKKKKNFKCEFKF